MHVLTAAVDAVSLFLFCLAGAGFIWLKLGQLLSRVREMKSFRIPRPLIWALAASATFWVANVWSLYALNMHELSVPIYFSSRYLACALAAIPAAVIWRFSARGFATMFVFPCIAVFNGYVIWNSNGELEIWPVFAVADLICLLPSMGIHHYAKSRAGRHNMEPRQVDLDDHR